MNHAHKIMVVDDEEANRILLEYMLEDHGFEVVVAASGAECLTMINQEVPDLLLIDIMMPDMTGYELCAQLRNDPVTESTPIFFLSALNADMQMAHPTDDEPEEYLTKPVDVDEIERALVNGEGSNETLPIPEEFQSLDRHEREYIEYVLAASNGNISHAARRLGLHRQSLQRKLRKFTPR